MSYINAAVKTMQIFNDCIERDQGSTYRKNLGLVLPHIEDAYREDDGGFRSHLGVSMIGEECCAKLFYNFRWATKPKFDGRTLRLFNRGHLEEGRFIALLLTAGMQVFQQDINGHQFRISFRGGHFGSATDGFIIGCPDLNDPSQTILTEMKTHNLKSFTAVKKNGVEESKPEHYDQMQVYMRSFNVPVALYLATCKDNDDIWAELVYLKPEHADQRIDKGIRITTLDMPPERVSNSPMFFKCKWCEHRPVCHYGAMPEVNCRTCRYSDTVDDGTWICRMDNKSIDKERQLVACEHYNPAQYYGKTK